MDAEARALLDELSKPPSGVPAGPLCAEIKVPDKRLELTLWRQRATYDKERFVDPDVEIVHTRGSVYGGRDWSAARDRDVAILRRMFEWLAIDELDRPTQRTED
jgi:hypothetical protein